MTATVRCRPWVPEDLDDLARHADDRAVWLNVRDRFPHPYTRADAAAWIAHQMARDGPALNFAIEHDGEVVGATGIEQKSDVYRVGAEIGYWVARAYWGQGIATEAVRWMTTYAFKTFPLERLEAGVYEWNPASARVLEKCGYTLEARLRRAVVKDGRVGDVLLYARLRHDRGTHASSSSASVPSRTAE